MATTYDFLKGLVQDIQADPLNREVYIDGYARLLELRQSHCRHCSNAIYMNDLCFPHWAALRQTVC